LVSFTARQRVAALAASALLLAGACDSDSDTTPGSVTSSASGSGGSGALPEPARHRAEAAACTGSPPPGNTSMPGSACEQDGDCTAGENGRCIWPFGGENLCMYDECVEDQDCGGASVCACRVDDSFGMNRCFHGNCVVDADCGEGGYCSPSAVHVSPSCMEGISPGSIGFFCHTAGDECTDDPDCGDPQGFACLFQVESARWECHILTCLL
jgi:hypothetical protein